MALYELTLLRPDGQQELRYTDHPPMVGGTVRIDNHIATVVSRDTDASHQDAVARFVCKLPLGDRSGSG